MSVKQLCGKVNVLVMLLNSAHSLAASFAAPACKVSSSAVSRQLEMREQGACLFRANLPGEFVSLVTSKKL